MSVSPEEMASSVAMALGMWGAVGPSNHVFHGGSGSTHGKGQFWGISSPLKSNGIACSRVLSDMYH